MRKTTCLAFSLILLLGLTAQTSTVRADDAKKPNILFVFADDLAFEATGFMGNKEIQTTELDRLASQGTVFTRAYNMGSWSGAVCLASRAMLNTGRFVWHAHRLDSNREQAAGRYWSQYMNNAGYDTYMTGKWHVKADAADIFGTTAHVRGGMPNQTKAGYNRPLPGKPDVWQPWDTAREGFWKGGKHWSEVVADDAIDFLGQATKSDKPFFMYIAFNAPHDPRQAPKEYVERYPADKVAVPKNFLAEYPYCRDIGCSPRLRDAILAPFPRTEHAVQVHRQEYYAIIDHMDDQIARIMAALKKSGKADNTYVVFTADHGLAVGHHGLMGKQNMYDHSVRVPFFVIGPDVKQGERNDAPIYLQDVMPTTLELAGVEKPAQVQFNSLLPLLSGEQKESPYDAIYGAYLGVQRAVTYDGHKLILYPTIGKARLYDLESDPLEMNDLADKAGSLATMQKLFAKLRELQKETGDTMDLAAKFPKLAK